MSALITAVLITTASWYGPGFDGKATASGQRFDPAAMTCASWDYPLGTVLHVSHGSRCVRVLVNDRGPAKRFYRRGRRLDLSRAAFARLAHNDVGLIRVEVRREW